MAARELGTWQGFLPRGAVVMARKAAPLSAESAPASAETVPTNTPTASTKTAAPADLETCQLCGRRQIGLFIDGRPKADLIFIGEGPITGEAGQLLDRMIQAMGLTRKQIPLAEVADCLSCRSFLESQIDRMSPKVVVALGEFAARTLLKTEEPIGQLRGKLFPYRDGAKLIPTFDPGFLLTNPGAKREAWNDLQIAARELGLELPKKGGTSP